MLLKFLALAVLTIAVYWPAMHADFVYDDAHFVIGNEAVREGIFHLNTARMVTLASYRVQFLTTGENPLYFHLGNLLIHILNGGLVFLIAKMVFTFGDSAAMFTSGLFLLHPLVSQAVIYISGRSELLAMMFILLSVLAFSRSWYIPAVIAFILAIESKEIALVTPLLWWITARQQKRSAWILVCLGLGALISPFWWYTAIIRENAHLSTFYEIAALLTKAVLPIGLTVDHDFTNLPQMYGILAAIGIAIALTIALIYRRKLAGAAILWIGALTLPHVLVEPQGYLAEHHFYAPMLGIAVLLTLMLQTISTFSERIVYEQFRPSDRTACQ